MAASQKKPDPVANPDVCVGDHVYFQHPQGPHAAQVKAVGKHGITVHHADKPHRVRWEHVLGHKSRASQQYSVLEEGEDGMIVSDAGGKRRYLNIAPEARGEKMVLGKAFSAGRLAVFVKAGPIKNRSGLHVEQKTDKNGKSSKHWVRTQDAGAAAGYGTHNLQAGDHVSFKNGEHDGQGTIHTIGEHGVVAHDAAGGEHRVLHHQITGHKPAVGTTKPDAHQQVLGKQTPVSADKFDAAAYAKSHDQADVTPAAILANFPPDTAAKISEVQKRLASIEQTISQYQADGKWTAEREKLHASIIDSILSDERITSAKPPEGQAPTFTVLGGRGGSGKSWFAGQVYDPDKAIVLDADHIKSQLPEYEGWNAAQVHQESSDIFEQITDMAAQLGLNMVHDATLKTTTSAVDKVKQFRDRGYQVEAHYMHLPRQEAAKRAVSRFLGKTQRYVPVDVVLSNTTNETSFDAVRKLADKWSFRDNNVPQGSEPVLISESGVAEISKQDASNGKQLTKSDQYEMILLWKR